MFTARRYPNPIPKYLIRILYPNRILRNRIRISLFFSDIFQIRIVTLYLLSVSDRIRIIDFRIFPYEKLSESDTILHYPIVSEGYLRIQIVILNFL
jgi:hypothetical protein